MSAWQKKRNLFTSERRSGIEAVNAEWMPVIKASAVLILAWNSAFFLQNEKWKFLKETSSLQDSAPESDTISAAENKS